MALAMLCLGVLLFAFFTSGSEDGNQIMVQLGERTGLPEGWKRVGAALGSQKITFIVALKQRNLAVLEDLYNDRTDPDSPHYRDWMTIEEIHALVAPSKTVQQSVVEWLSAHQIRSKVLGDAIEATASVAQLQSMMRCQMHTFQHDELGKTIAIWGKYFVPKKIHAVIDMIAGLTTFPDHNMARVKTQAKTKKAHRGQPVDPRDQRLRGIFDAETYVTPAMVWNNYQIPLGTIVKNANVSQGVIEWEDQYFDSNDYQQFGQQILGGSVLSPIIVGENNPSAPGVESMLDVEWIAATGQGAQQWFWIEGANVWLYGFAVHFMNTQTVPLVASMSYAWNEEMQCEAGIGNVECQQLGVNSTQYVARVNTEFIKIGLRGVSLFAASGDSGANGRTDEYCTENHFNPPFPAASPYVTSVGATQVFDAVFDLTNPPPICSNGGWTNEWWCGSSSQEHAVSYSQAEFASGGGFSYVAAMPKYQQSAVWGYLNSSIGKQTPTSYFNPNGRAFPDLAALGSNILIWAGGAFEPVGGTSCAAPMVAGIFSLLNDYAVTKTGKSLGPVNALLYKMAAVHPAAFTDVTVGDNACTESGCESSCLGFSCAPGWDPVTGLGTPVYTEMLKYIKSIL